MSKAKINANEFVEALSGISEAKGLSREAILLALEEAITRAYIRYLGGKNDDPLDAIVTCTVDPESGEIVLYSTKKVVEEPEDDYREIALEDANAGRKRAKYKIGDDYIIPASVEELTKVTALAIKNNFRQRLNEAEKQSLYQTYKDHIGEMLSGIVEKCDEHSITIRIDKKVIELTRKELIGDEMFRYGDPIKVYIEEVKQPEPVDGKPSHAPQIQPTRASEGFLKRLFEEEIHEIYDGTVLIKAMARIAGQRSKVAVYSANEDIDATGACIGQGGSRIQKIVAQLGNGKNKEKIDVIHYYENRGVFIIEAVRPAVALGVNLNEEEKTAQVLIEDGTMSLAMGKFKSNLTLASRISGYRIEFIEKSIAEERGLSFVSAEEWALKAEEEKRAKEREVLIRRQKEELARREEEARRIAAEEEAKRIAEEEAARKAEEEARAKEEEAAAASKASQKPVKKVEPIVMPTVMPKANVNPEEFPTEAINPAAAALASMRAAEEARKAAEAAAKEAAVNEPEPVKEETVTEVKTTTTLSDLEKELENSKAKPVNKSKSAKRPRKISEEEVAHEPIKPAVPTMPVYTEEELSQMALEDEDVEYDQTDEEIEEEYAEYDDYYDDDK